MPPGCICERIVAAVREVLEEAEKIALTAEPAVWPGVVDTGHIWRLSQSKAIAAAIAALKS